MNKEKFKKDMEVFSFKQHQDVLTYLNHLEASGWTVEDAKEWIEMEKKKLADNSQGTPYLVFSCPICSKHMNLLPVNVNEATKTNDGSKSVWICSNKDCMHTIYNIESIDEIIRNIKNGK